MNKTWYANTCARKSVAASQARRQMVRGRVEECLAEVEGGSIEVGSGDVGDAGRSTGGGTTVKEEDVAGRAVRAVDEKEKKERRLCRLLLECDLDEMDVKKILGREHVQATVGGVEASVGDGKGGSSSRAPLDRMVDDVWKGRCKQCKLVHPDTVDDWGRIVMLYCLRCKPCQKWVRSLSAFEQLMVHGFMGLQNRLKSGDVSMLDVEAVMGQYNGDAISELAQYKAGKPFSEDLEQVFSELDRLGYNPFIEYEAEEVSGPLDNDDSAE